MPGQNFRRRCIYAEKCPIFKGEEKVKDMPLFLYRNVFCNRGQKGWDNCEKFIKLKLGELNDSNENAAE